jgi:hypothetical protein
MCVATAMILAAFFLMLHANYAPYRSLALNRIQQFALVIVSIVYLTGEWDPSE